MANIRKSFNFRNGVQVDNNNFVVNANGLVGIGSSAPTSELDVSGGVKVSGLVTSSTLGSGIGTITNFTATNASVGVLTATTLSVGGNLVTNLVGFAFTAFVTDNGGVGLHTTSKIGIGVTTSPGASDSELTVSGNVNATGIVTANSFSGDLNGNVNATSGVSTFTELKVGTAITMSAGIITATTFSGSLPTSSLTGTISSTQIANSAVTDAKIDTVSASKLTGALPAISGASLTNVPAVSITGSPNVNLGVTTTGNLTAGSITGAGLSVTSIGIGTVIPANTFQQRATGATELQVTSDTASASITVGREPGTANTNNAEFRYGLVSTGSPYSSAQSLDIINHGLDNFNYVLSGNNPAGATGDFHWLKGFNNTRLMTLTKSGNLGIGETQPQERLTVAGVCTVTANSFVGGNFDVSGNAIIGGNLTLGGSLNISAITSDLTGNVTGNLTGNVNATIGISSFRKIGINTTVNNIGSADLDCLNANAVFKRVGIGSTEPDAILDVSGDLSQPSKRFIMLPKVSAGSTAVIQSDSAEGGGLIYNTTLRKLQFFNGTNWETVTSVEVFG